MTTQRHDNPTRAFLADALEQRRFGTPLDINPAFTSLETTLLEGTPGAVSIGFTAGPHTLQGNGVVGGGTLAQMLDCALALAGLSVLAPGQTCATISLTVHMQRPAAPGRFTASAKVERSGRTVSFTTAQLFDANGKLVASGSSSLAVFAEPVPA